MQPRGSVGVAQARLVRTVCGLSGPVWCGQGVVWVGHGGTGSFWIGGLPQGLSGPVMGTALGSPQLRVGWGSASAGALWAVERCEGGRW